MTNEPGKVLAPKVFVLDVDGVMTTGQFFYSEAGKMFKVFGPDDHDALVLLKPYLTIRFITGDSKGFAISRKRIVDDMHFQLDLVSTVKRVEWISEHYDPASVIFMGDGIFDHYVFRAVGYAIAPRNAALETKKFAHFVTESAGGDRAVAEASLHILDRFFAGYNPLNPLEAGLKASGQWGA